MGLLPGRLGVVLDAWGLESGVWSLSVSQKPSAPLVRSSSSPSPSPLGRRPAPPPPIEPLRPLSAVCSSPSAVRCSPYCAYSVYDIRYTIFNIRSSTRRSRLVSSFYNHTTRSLHLFSSFISSHLLCHLLYSTSIPLSILVTPAPSTRIPIYPHARARLIGSSKLLAPPPCLSTCDGDGSAPPRAVCALLRICHLPIRHPPIRHPPICHSHPPIRPSSYSSFVRSSHAHLPAAVHRSFSRLAIYLSAQSAQPLLSRKRKRKRIVEIAVL